MIPFTRLENRCKQVMRPSDETVLVSANGPVTYGQYKDAIRSLGIRPGDRVLVHSETTTFGRLGQVRDRWAFADAWLSGWLDVLGPSGTLIIPTFTYSFTRKLDYDPLISRPTIGLLPERIIEWPGVVRSNNPLFSFAAIGPDAESLMDSDITHCFAPAGIHRKMFQERVKFCFVGQQDLQMVTSIHSIEHFLKVPYRAPKLFTGNILLDVGPESMAVEFFARKLQLGYVADFTKVQQMFRTRGLARYVPLGWGQISYYDPQELWNTVVEEYAKDPFLLVRGSVSS